MVSCEYLSDVISRSPYSFSTGVVTSANFPSNYPLNYKKTDMIMVDQGMVISLQFTKFDVYSSDVYLMFTTTVCKDYLSITDGDGTLLMEETCGTSLPDNITSTSNIVQLHFKSSYEDNNMRGWSLQWRTVVPGKFI